jgi:hypothetical protein
MYSNCCFVFLIRNFIREAARITAAEMKYLRRTAGYTWTDHITNTDIAKELNITPVLDRIQN